jgi:hypothetical protein
MTRVHNSLEYVCIPWYSYNYKKSKNSVCISEGFSVLTSTMPFCTRITIASMQVICTKFSVTTMASCGGGGYDVHYGQRGYGLYVYNRVNRHFDPPENSQQKKSYQPLNQNSLVQRLTHLSHTGLMQHSYQLATLMMLLHFYW